jgi:hypothetical protein
MKHGILLKDYVNRKDWDVVEDDGDFEDDDEEEEVKEEL